MSPAAQRLSDSRHQLLRAWLQAQAEAGQAPPHPPQAGQGAAQAHAAATPAAPDWLAAGLKVAAQAATQAALWPTAQRHPLALVLAASLLGAGAGALVLRPGARCAAGWLLTRLPPRVAWAGLSLAGRLAWQAWLRNQATALTSGR